MITECESCKFKIATTESLESERNNLREALEQIKIADKTPEYNYGAGKGAMNRLGQLPGIGKRWLTPKDLATVALFDSVKESLTQPNQNRGEVVG